MYDVNNHDPNYEKSLPFIFGTPVQLAECAIKVLQNHSHDIMSKSRKHHRPSIELRAECDISFLYVFQILMVEGGEGGGGPCMRTGKTPPRHHRHRRRHHPLRSLCLWGMGPAPLLKRTLRRTRCHTVRGCC